MKKVLLAILVIIGFHAASVAQTAPATKTATTQAKKEDKASVNKEHAKATTPAIPEKPAKDEKAAGPVKKDGTPDKRYKANQAKASGPAKKDGTPDMRYKANKKKAAK
ncbi:hypothetical protein [Paraflavitalea pollutisoli]|uniref:hypothetical protein n=1 Tax=Paraflavitalea pollutisoli TaxID=3034143 RepID=UPI0023ED0F02|nr:hypothetical protein [Paraflavitalea sp. H1-2-19X]